MVKITIEWNKVEEEPYKIQKIKGQYLLDFRAKVDSLEKGIFDYKAISNESSIELERLKKELHDVKGDLSSTIEKNKSLNTEFAKLKECSSDLETKLKNAEETIKKINNDLEENLNKKDELKKILSEKEEQLSQKEIEIEEEKKEIASIKISFDNMNQELELFKENYRKKISDLKLKIFELNSSKKSIDNVIKDTSNNQEIINKIEELLNQKGFVSDKEYESFSKKNLYQIYF